MKLETLMEQSPDFSFMKDQFSSEYFSEFSEILKTYTKGFKFVGETEKKENAFDLRFNNGVVDLLLSIYISGKDGDRYAMFGIDCAVEQRFMIDSEKAKDSDRRLVSTTEFVHLSEIEESKSKARLFQKIINDFVEWYFDMSGSYGKVKLLGTQYNVIDGYHRGGEQRFVAIAGDFHADYKLDRDKIEQRVF